MVKVSRKFRSSAFRISFVCLGVLILLFGSMQHTPSSSSGVRKYKRTQRQHEACNKIGYTKEDLLLSGVLVRRRNDLMYYCDVPKCGSTFMKLFLNDTFGCDDCYTKKVRMPPERKYYDETKKMLRTSTYSFTFVREPYSRLFAAFLNKLYCPNNLWLKLGVQIVKAVRKNASPLSKQYGHDVTFTEMVKFVISAAKRGVYLNIHLAPMYTRCDPCQMNFNFIGKLENMTHDLRQLGNDLKKYGIDIENDVDLKEIEFKSKRDIGPVQHLFTMLESCKDLSRYLLFSRLWTSYQMRGLILDEYKMPFKKYLVDSIDKLMYTLAVESAMEKSMHNRTALRAQRDKSLLQAYRSLPRDYLYGLKDVYEIDFALFGYDPTPPSLFEGHQENF